MLWSGSKPQTVVRESMWGFLLFAGAAWLAISWSVLRLEPTDIVQVAGPVLLFGALTEGVRALAGTKTWWLNAGMAALFTGTGLVLLTSADSSFTTPAALVGWYLMVRGTADVAVAMMTRETDRIWGLLMVVGVLETGLGFFVASPLARTADLVVTALGGLALARGVADLVAALRLREVSAAPSEVPGFPEVLEDRAAGYSAGLTDAQGAAAQNGPRHRAALRPLSDSVPADLGPGSAGSEGAGPGSAGPGSAEPGGAGAARSGSAGAGPARPGPAGAAGSPSGTAEMSRASWGTSAMEMSVSAGSSGGPRTPDGRPEFEAWSVSGTERSVDGPAASSGRDLVTSSGRSPAAGSSRDLVTGSDRSPAVGSGNSSGSSSAVGLGSSSGAGSGGWQGSSSRGSLGRWPDSSSTRSSGSNTGASLADGSGDGQDGGSAASSTRGPGSNSTTSTADGSDDRPSGNPAASPTTRPASNSTPSTAHGADDTPHGGSAARSISGAGRNLTTSTAGYSGASPASGSGPADGPAGSPTTNTTSRPTTNTADHSDASPTGYSGPGDRPASNPTTDATSSPRNNPATSAAGHSGASPAGGSAESGVEVGADTSSYDDEVLRTTAALDAMLALAGVTGAGVAAGMAEHYQYQSVSDSPKGVEISSDTAEMPAVQEAEDGISAPRDAVAREVRTASPGAEGTSITAGRRRSN